MKVEITGAKELESKLENVADIDWDRIYAAQGEEMLARSDAVTPYKTGELRSSAQYDDGEFGYTADYAPDVNYGHRTRNGGYVEGQHFLEEVVNGQEENFKELVMKELEEKLR